MTVLELMTELARYNLSDEVWGRTIYTRQEVQAKGAASATEIRLVVYGQYERGWSPFTAPIRGVIRRSDQ